jgi:hypothetical protein
MPTKPVEMSHLDWAALCAYLSVLIGGLCQ